MTFDDFTRRYVNARLFMDRLGSRERHRCRHESAGHVSFAFQKPTATSGIVSGTLPSAVMQELGLRASGSQAFLSVQRASG